SGVLRGVRSHHQQVVQEDHCQVQHETQQRQAEEVEWRLSALEASAVSDIATEHYDRGQAQMHKDRSTQLSERNRLYEDLGNDEAEDDVGEGQARLTLIRRLVPPLEQLPAIAHRHHPGS